MTINLTWFVAYYHDGTSVRFEATDSGNAQEIALEMGRVKGAALLSVGRDIECQD